MKIGVPAETKSDEHRIALTPSGARELTARGHRVLVEAGAGEGSALTDQDFANQGAEIVPDAEAVFSVAELVVKVKEPQPPEVELLHEGQLLFTYLHLAAVPELTKSLVRSGATCLAYETVEDDAGRLPLLAPMSEIAGKLATQAGAHAAEKPCRGRGILLGGAPGVLPGRVLVIGGGVVGFNAAVIALGMQARVTICDRNVDRLRELESIFNGRVDTLYASTLSIEEQLAEADVVVGAVLIHGARAPRVVREDQLSSMKLGAVLVDVSIDQGGCFETSRPTTHSAPTYVTEGVVHYCVANMPGALPVTSTWALTNATLPFVVELADHGLKEAVSRNRMLERGVNIAAEMVTVDDVAKAAGMSPVAPAEAVEAVG